MRPKRRIGRGWPHLGAAPGLLRRLSSRLGATRAEAWRAVFSTQAGADPNLRVRHPEGRGQTAAHRAAQAGNAGVVASLLVPKHRTNWGLRDEAGSTPRQLASQGGKVDVLRLLDAAGITK